MPGRNINLPSPEHVHRAPHFLMIAVLGAVTLLAFGIAIGSRIASPQQASRPSPTAAVDISSNSVPTRRHTKQRTQRTRSGAVRAAARSITVFDGTVLLQPTRLQAVVSRIASHAARPQLLALFAEASAQTRAKLGADSVPRPMIVLRSVPVGYRVERYTSAESTVAVWYVGIVGSGATVLPQQSWRTQVVSLVWEAGAWKVSSFASSPGPTPPLSTTENAYAPGDLFTAIPRFEEFERAEP